MTPGTIILGKMNVETNTDTDAVFAKLYRNYFGKSVSQMEQEDISMLVAGFSYDPKICNFKFGNHFRYKLFRFSLGKRSSGKTKNV